MSKANDFTEDTVPTPEENGVLDEPIPAAAAPPEDDVSVFLDETDTPTTDSIPTEDVPEDPAPTAAKPKRASRKKKAEAEPAPDKADTVEETVTENAEEAVEPPVMLDDDALDALFDESDDVPLPPPPPVTRSATTRTPNASILTLEVRGDVETKSDRDDIIWHEIHNAYRTRKILTGQLGGVEQMENNKTIVIVDYKGFRVVIPLKEMMIQTNPGVSGKAYEEFITRKNKLLSKMLGAEIDFIVRGIDSKTRAIVASRKEAMLKKRQTFYMDLDANGVHRIHEGRLVQARVIAVAEKGIRVEIFGVECSIVAKDLAWYWIGDAREYYSIGDNVLVRIQSVQRDSVETIKVVADVRSVTQDNTLENLRKCKVQSKYAGKVTDIHKGVVFIRLSNGVNAIAHSCYDFRTPGKKDDVSFVVTRLDEDHGVAVGIITRVIRQNL